ncbi:hypothetical protein [Edaphobacillus lindanitolerans]|uniref:Uncharacterized protein n=1 Tax=Edaphobacillus lindanitolerans TaxID=550447 RepID=A0A1U7PLD9_9BACI|nr:hypothetical protein [Edaphobacillus lindanitolerans]SIT75010.1 hypothetical protein SAMN05428946_1126 [Edaphobacillus lindanitolerans]
MKQNSGLVPLAAVFLIVVIILMNLVFPALAFRWKMVFIIAILGITGALIMAWSKRRKDGGE